MTVHNHGPSQGAGLDCPEQIVNGELKGACMTTPAIPAEVLNAAVKAGAKRLRTYHSVSMPLGCEGPWQRYEYEARLAITDALPVLLAAAKADALDEAAEGLPLDCHDPRHMADLLRARAATYRKESK